MTELLYLDMEKHGIVLQRTEFDTASNVPQVVTHHSPTGFEWGYGGSGPADLALNILEVVLRRMGYDGPTTNDTWRKDTCFVFAWNHHQDFKWEFIAPLPQEGGAIPYDRVVTWINARLFAETLLENNHE